MNAGDLDRRIQFQSDTGTADSGGQRVSSWATFYTCWASKAYAKAAVKDEAFRDQQFVAHAYVTFRIRYPQAYATAITANETVRVLDETGAAFDILSVNQIGRREGLEIFAYSRGDQ